MRKYFLLLVALSLFFESIGQDKHMDFVQGDWQTLLEKAKKEKKPFFVDFYTEWCGWCKVMEKKTFNNEEVVDYVEKHYLAYQIDAEKGEGIQLRRQYGINSFPTILIFDKDGNMTMRVLGYQDVHAFLQILEENKDKKAGASATPATPKATNGNSYFAAKKPYFDQLEELINTTKNEEIRKLEQKALQYGRENDHFNYSELQYTAEKDFNVPLKNRLEMYYHMGRNDKDRMATAAKSGLFQGEFSDLEDHYILLLLLQNNIADVEMLVMINQMTLKSKDYDLLDTKAAIQFFVGDKEDAYNTAKKAKKIGEKAGKDVSSTVALMALIQ